MEIVLKKSLKLKPSACTNWVTEFGQSLKNLRTFESYNDVALKDLESDIEDTTSLCRHLPILSARQFQCSRTSLFFLAVLTLLDLLRSRWLEVFVKAVCLRKNTSLATVALPRFSRRYMYYNYTCALKKFFIVQYA